jgi:hypothetical protein
VIWDHYSSEIVNEIKKISVLTTNTLLNEAKIWDFDFSEIVTRHLINYQFAPVCSEFFGKFNETNGDFIASVLFQKNVRNRR